MTDRSAALAAFDAAAFPGAAFLGGIDEAGRGPLFGPVVAACVVWPAGAPLPFVDDSKKLSAARRERLFELIMTRAAGVGLGISSVEEIDEMNIRCAARRAMERAAAACARVPEGYLIDYESGLALPAPHKAFVGGDGLSLCVAAASVLAKVSRDRMMAELDGQFPGYDLTRNKGYGTSAHMQALRVLGPTPMHRRSFLRNL